MRTRPRWPWLAGGGALFLLAAALAAYVGEYGFHWPGVSAAPQGPADAAGVAATATGPGGTATVTGAAPTQGTGPGAPPAAAPPGQVALAFDFAADSWIEIYDATGATVLYDLATAGTQRSVTGASPLRVTLGNAPAVTLSVNGHRVAVPTPPAGQTVTRFGIGPGGTVRQDAG